MKILPTIAMSVLTATLLVSNAQAMSGHPKFDFDLSSFFQAVHKHQHGCHGSGGPVGETQSVPEMDGAGAGIALGLLATLVAIRRERARSSKLQNRK